MQSIRKDLRVYVDNSVINAPFDTGCDHAVQSKPFWNAVIGGNVRIIVSDILRIAFYRLSAYCSGNDVPCGLCGQLELSANGKYR